MHLFFSSKNTKKHCQRHNGPEGWVHLKVTSWGHIMSSYTELTLCRARSLSLKLVLGVQLRLTHPALPSHFCKISSLNEIALVKNFPCIMGLSRWLISCISPRVPFSREKKSLFYMQNNKYCPCQCQWSDSGPIKIRTSDSGLRASALHRRVLSQPCFFFILTPRASG